MATLIRAAEIGRLKTMAALPCDSVSDWRKLFSRRGLRIIAMTMGPASERERSPSTARTSIGASTTGSGAATIPPEVAAVARGDPAGEP